MGRSDPVRGCTCTEGRPSHGEAGFAGQTAAPTTAPPCLSLASLCREPPALALSLGSPAWDFVGPPPRASCGPSPSGAQVALPRKGVSAEFRRPFRSVCGTGPVSCEAGVR